MIFDRGAKTTGWGRDCLFNQWCWENWIVTYKKKKKKLYPCITLYKKLTQNRLKIKHKIKIYKTKGKRRGKFFYDIGLRDDFFDMTTEAQVTIKGMVKVRLH